MSRAFFVPDGDWRSPIVLEGAEAVHARASRLEPGETVKVLDGNGGIAVCRVARMQRKRVELEIISTERISPPASRAIMAIAVSKAARRGFFLEKAAELGAWEIWLWHAERSQGRPTQELVESCRAKLVAGIKQCENPWLPRLRAFESVFGVAEAAACADFRILPFEERAGQPMLTEGELGRAGATVYAIGPEGGYAPAELDALAAAGFTPVSLGKRVLRCETAAALCLGLHWWASQLPGRVDGA